MSYGHQAQIQVPPFFGATKYLVIANVACWLGLVMVLDKFLGVPILQWFGLQPYLFIQEFHIWQPFSYMFLHHPGNPMHVLFNMLILWMIGSELEQYWGRRFFLSYYLVSGVGAGLIYSFVALIYHLAIDSNSTVMLQNVIGASGGVFGLILAYGIVFSERPMLFMFIFPMKAKHFAMVLAGIEVLNLLSAGFRSEVANLAHLGGLIAGFLYLWGYTRYQKGNSNKSGGGKKRGRNLRLVVNNEDPSSSEPRYWN
jgi:membrane associated rhomboid family serine protease